MVTLSAASVKSSVDATPAAAPLRKRVSAAFRGEFLCLPDSSFIVTLKPSRRRMYSVVHRSRFMVKNYVVLDSSVYTHTARYAGQAGVLTLSSTAKILRRSGMADEVISLVLRHLLTSFYSVLYCTSLPFACKPCILRFIVFSM
jgi:hypothetical protein